ncbi:MAG: hypothetical protein B6244_06285 [Candidatus Cloacimonetes bacterium 4572_55]|nr:MAG: hypothetical protein B6244_06285 [Candidatus Cloacimonetes bacterium 4572_55]
MKIIVLGCGLVGGVIAKDMFDRGYQVTVADISSDALARVGDYPDIVTEKANLTNSDRLQALIDPFDLVIGAVPGFMGFNTVKHVIQSRKNIVDISFFPENALELESFAYENHVQAVVDCGVAPGFSHLAFGFLSRYFDDPISLACYVGGLPIIREKPFEYKIVFSPFDVIEEYTRPARIVYNGKVQIKEPLSEVEALYFDQIGTLEAFNSDGLRTLIHTLKVPNMIEKTLRYPGHAEKMKLLRDAGFFSQTPVMVHGALVSPLDMTAKTLFQKLKMREDEQDLTVMRIIGIGRKGDKVLRYSFEMCDRYDPEKKFTSMARTTGFTCSSTAHLLLQGHIEQRGLICPEYQMRAKAPFS